MKLTLGKVKKSFCLSPSSHWLGLKEEARVNVASAGRLASRSKLVSLSLGSKSIVLIGSFPSSPGQTVILVGGLRGEGDQLTVLVSVPFSIT